MAKKKKRTSFQPRTTFTPATSKFVPSASIFTPSPGYTPQPDAPPAPDPGPPADPYLDAQKAAADRNLKFGDAADAYQKTQIENRYGFGTDTSNPYSVAKLLQDSYQKSQKATSLGMAAQGQLYSGALQSKLEQGTRDYNIDFDRQKRSYQDQLYELLLGKAQRYGSTIADISNEQRDSLLRALGGS